MAEHEKQNRNDSSKKQENKNNAVVTKRAAKKRKGDDSFVTGEEMDKCVDDISRADRKSSKKPKQVAESGPSVSTTQKEGNQSGSTLNNNQPQPDSSYGGNRRQVQSGSSRAQLNSSVPGGLPTYDPHEHLTDYQRQQLYYGSHYNSVQSTATGSSSSYIPNGADGYWSGQYRGVGYTQSVLNQNVPIPQHSSPRPTWPDAQYQQLGNSSGRTDSSYYYNNSNSASNGTGFGLSSGHSSTSSIVSESQVSGAYAPRSYNQIQNGATNFTGSDSQASLERGNYGDTGQADYWGQSNTVPAGIGHGDYSYNMGGGYASNNQTRRLNNYSGGHDMNSTSSKTMSRGKARMEAGIVDVRRNSEELGRDLNTNDSTRKFEAMASGEHEEEAAEEVTNASGNGVSEPDVVSTQQSDNSTCNSDTEFVNDVLLDDMGEEEANFEEDGMVDVEIDSTAQVANNNSQDRQGSRNDVDGIDFQQLEGNINQNAMAPGFEWIRQHNLSVQEQVDKLQNSCIAMKQTVDRLSTVVSELMTNEQRRSHRPITVWDIESVLGQTSNILSNSARMKAIVRLLYGWKELVGRSAFGRYNKKPVKNDYRMDILLEAARRMGFAKPRGAVADAINCVIHVIEAKLRKRGLPVQVIEENE